MSVLTCWQEGYQLTCEPEAISANVSWVHDASAAARARRNECQASGKRREATRCVHLVLAAVASSGGLTTPLAVRRRGLHLVLLVQLVHANVLHTEFVVHHTEHVAIPNVPHGKALG